VGGEQNSNRRGLWCAVIDRALVDACKHNDSCYTSFTDIDAARDWLIGFSKDFQQVCAMADLSPETIQEKALALKGKGWHSQ